MKVSENHQLYWQKNLRITAILMFIWFIVTYALAYFARDLNFRFFGWPFSFWMAAQGSLIIYVLIIGYYARYMNRLDQEHGVAEEE
jgi:putative solute:sodium symporter small subunit